jgi:hypothetical protein
LLLQFPEARSGAMARLLTFACFSFSATGAASEIEGGPLAEECGANAEGTCPSRGQVLLQLGDARLNKPVVLADTSADEDAIAEEAWERKMVALVAEGSKVEEHSALQCPCEGPVRRRRREASKACRRRDRSLDVASDMWQCNEETNTMECTQEGESKPKESQGVSSGDDVGATASGKIGWPSGGETKNADKWCKINVPPSSWNLKSCPSDGGLKIKVLSYNLYWWNLFDKHGGGGKSAGKLIARTEGDEMYDFMGFQECDSRDRVIADAQSSGLDGSYKTINGGRALAIAYLKTRWTLLEQGREDVGEDSRSQYYGKRSLQWARFQHLETKKTVFVGNHHGPLRVSEGGGCTGSSTSLNIMKVVAENADVNDAIVLVGDFNAGRGSSRFKELEKRLVRAFSGNAIGGIDHVFTNCGERSSGSILGGGDGHRKSDHDALSVVLRI